MTEPVISIIVPVYNVEKYLRQCMDSIVNQTFRDVEIICVNNGSTDSSPEILAEYAEKDARVQVVHKKNGGIASARNAGMERVRGKYLLFIDSDDYVSPDLCAKTFRKAEETGAEMTLFYYASDDGLGNISPIKFPQSEFLGTSQTGNVKAFMELGPVVWKTLWQTAFIKKYNLRFRDGILMEDVAFIVRASIFVQKTAIVRDQLYFYRVNPDSTTRKKSSNFCRFNVKAFNYAWQDIQDGNPSEDILRHLLKEKLIFVYYGYVRTARELKREFRRNIRDGVLPGELERLRRYELDVLPLIRFFFLSIYGAPGEKLNAKLKMLKYHTIRLVEKIFHIHIYPVV